MSFCPKCGREITDERLGCPVCNQQQAEQIDSFVVEDDKGMYQKFENNQAYQPTEQVMHPALKVLIIALIILIGGIGAVAGLIGGIVLMKSPIVDYQKFGKLMMIISIIMLALSLVCCLLYGMLYGVTFMRIM